PTAGELVERYALGSRRDLGAIRWYAVLGCYKLGILQEGTYARAFAGKARMEQGERLHRATVGLFERALGWIESTTPFVSFSAETGGRHPWLTRILITVWCA